MTNPCNTFSNQSLQLPNHIAVIMDGNGRWAKKQQQKRSFGHEKGTDALDCAVNFMLEQRIPYFTIFALSSENIHRPPAEVDFLWQLFRFKIIEKEASLCEQRVRVQVIGDRKNIPDDVLHQIEQIEWKTKDNDRLVLSIAINYGGRWDIIQAVQKMMIDTKLVSIHIDEKTFHQYLSTVGIPDPDILLRTGGDLRVSNFLLWQIAYTELFFSKKNWPDFNQNDWQKLISDYQVRHRSYGLLELEAT